MYLYTKCLPLTTAQPLHPVTKLFSIPFESGYCVTKYGVEALSDALRRELSPWGVLVSMIEPGGHKTGIFNEKVFSKNMHDLWDELSPEVKKDYGEQYRDKGNNINTILTIFCSFVVRERKVQATSQSQRHRDTFNTEA